MAQFKDNRTAAGYEGTTPEGWSEVGHKGTKREGKVDRSQGFKARRQVSSRSLGYNVSRAGHHDTDINFPLSFLKGVRMLIKFYLKPR